MQLCTIPASGFAANCYLLWEDVSRQALLVDPTASVSAVAAALRERGVTLTGILLTHGHFDHILTLDALRDAFGVPAYVHRADAEMLGDPVRNVSALLVGEQIRRRPAEELWDGGETLTLGEETLTVLSTPGHTPGSVCFRGKDFLVSGDTLFDRSIGRTDLPGGSFSVLSASLAGLCLLPGDTRVYPGHGPDTTIEEQIKANPYL